MLMSGYWIPHSHHIIMSLISILIMVMVTAALLLLLRELQIFGLRCTVMLPIVSISLLADLHTQSHAGVQVQAAR